MDWIHTYSLFTFIYDFFLQANASFASMIQMTSLVHSFSSAFPSLEGISSHREGISALQQLVSGEGMAALRKKVLGDVELNMDITGMFQKVGDLKVRV